jgi:Fibronectin type III domain
VKTNIRNLSRFRSAIAWGGIVLLIIFGVFLPASAVGGTQTQSVTLAWNRSTNVDVVGYDIYYGEASGIYTNKISVGNVTTLTVAGLQDGSTYYFAATAVNSLGVESGFSNQATYSAPALAALLQPSASVSGGFSLAVSGVPGFNYVIQASTNLVQWVPVQTNLAPFSFVDSNTGRFHKRFYRAVYLP